MIDDISNNLSQNLDHFTDKNQEIGNRVKVFTKVNRWMDNFLRVDFKLIVFDFFRMLIVFTFIGLLYYNNYNSKEDLTIKDNIVKIGTQVSNLAIYTNEIFLNNYSQKINTLLEQLEVHHYLSFYPIEKVEASKDLKIDKVILYYIYFIVFGLVVFFFLIFLQYYSSKVLFASTLMNMYVPLIFLPTFYKRHKQGYILIRLIRHQKQKNIYSSLSHLVISNLFHLTNLNEDDKLEVQFKPKKFFLYDYIDLSYTINSQTSKVQPKSNTDIEKINNKIDAVFETVENSNNSELELINLEELEKLNI